MTSFKLKFLDVGDSPRVARRMAQRGGEGQKEATFRMCWERFTEIACATNATRVHLKRRILGEERTAGERSDAFDPIAEVLELVDTEVNRLDVVVDRRPRHAGGSLRGNPI